MPSEIVYNIKAIETKFKGFTFRSRLEAKWAAMFELLGWNWDYEPVDFNGWIPDFVIYGKHHPIYVEVKPAIEFPKAVAEKMEKSGCTNEMLIVGQACLVPRKGEPSFDLEERLRLGWLAEVFPEEGEYVEDEDAGKLWVPYSEESYKFWWEPARYCRYKSGGGTIGFFHQINLYHDRITGAYEGGHWGDFPEEKIEELWAQAHNLTRLTKFKKAA